MGKKGTGQQQQGENIRVVVRARPLSKREQEQGSKEAVVLDVGTSSVSVYHAVGEPDRWTFDAVYNNKFSQQDIYLQEVHPLIQSVLEGYNATVFAYGQSGSGKTHTMTGAPGTTEAGVMPNAIQHIFDEISHRSSTQKQFKVRVSHLELYNGKARDLLSDSDQNLEIKQNSAKNFYVKGLEEQVVTGLKDTLKVFDESIDRRKTATTDLNEHSSRSHSIFCITIESLDFDADPTSPVHMCSKLNLVDLAGSERQGKTGTTGSTLKEGCNINLSLSALGTVIDTIVKGQPHVPYRSSPLTMLLKDSLGGNSKTVMFANVGPADRNISETISTLRFADRAKQIQNKPMKNLDPKDAQIQQLMQRIEELQHKLGGEGFDSEAVETLQAKVEQLEGELSMVRSEAERDILALSEELNMKIHTVNQLTKQIEEEKKVITSLQEDHDTLNKMSVHGEEQSKGLKSAVINFIRSTTTTDSLKKIFDQANLDIKDTDSDWEVSHFVVILEGLREMYTDIKRNSITAADVEKVLKQQATEFETKFGSYSKQQELEKTQLADAKRAMTEKIQAADQEAAKAKVELERCQQELEKLKQKAEKDSRRWKEKVEKALEEQRTLQDNSEKQAQEAAGKWRDEIAKVEEDARKARERLEADLQAAHQAAARSQQEWDQHRAALEKQVEAKAFDLKQLQTVVADMEQLVKKLQQEKSARKRESRGRDTTSDTTTSPDGEELGGDTPNLLNQTMIVLEDEPQADREVVEQLEQQIKLQGLLQQLRHQQQVHLDALLQRHQAVQKQIVEESERKAMQAVAAMQAQLAEKDREMQEVKERNAKEQERMLKKINKKLLEFKQTEQQFEEERALLEEEKKELLDGSEELNGINERLELEIENLKRRLDAAGMDLVQQEKDHRAEVASLNQEIEELRKDLATFRKVAEDMDAVRAEREQLQRQNERTEQMLKEQIISLENNRQMLKWSNGLLEKEKRKVEEAVAAMAELRRQFADAQEGCRREAEENAARLVAVHNRKLAEQLVHHQRLMLEEQEKQKQVRDKLRKSKAAVQKEKEKFDGLMIEYDQLEKQLEEAKVMHLRFLKEKKDLELDDSNNSISRLIRQQQEKRMESSLTFEQNLYSGRKR
eukprot:TRINITY_DN3465_c0_g1_i1.p1 TRINITY_DN3465_c0_g1~~TRINITY_DN3465_c0_g1_i1.p1  ORF type:complete len:1140 (+),score=366.51 TRINITY_DN3465_c0_g1_i1:48-3422(+)